MKHWAKMSQCTFVDQSFHKIFSTGIIITSNFERYIILMLKLLDYYHRSNLLDPEIQESPMDVFQLIH